MIRTSTGPLSVVIAVMMAATPALARRCRPLHARRWFGIAWVTSSTPEDTANAHVDVSWLVAARDSSHFYIWMSDALCQSLWCAGVSEHAARSLSGHPSG